MSDPVTLAPVSTNPELVLGGLYRHRTRPQWGTATLIEHGEGRLLLQFEDGELRKLSARFASLLAETIVPGADGEALRRRLEHLAGVSSAKRALQDEGKSVFSLDAQVALFRADFGEGFTDDAYVSRHREAKRRRKGHLTTAATTATTLLEEEALEGLIRAGDTAELARRIREVLEGTSLLTKGQLKPLASLSGDDFLRLGKALLDIIRGEDGPSVETIRVIGSVFTVRGRGPSWPLLTILPALLRPESELFIRDSVFGLQLRWLAPQLSLGRTADAAVYIRLRRLGLRLARELESRELKPRDLLDVQQFIFLTLRPAALKRLDRGGAAKGEADATPPSVEEAA